MSSISSVSSVSNTDSSETKSADEEIKVVENTPDIKPTLIELFWKLLDFNEVTPLPGLHMHVPTIDFQCRPYRWKTIVEGLDTSDADYSDVEVAPLLISDDPREREKLLREMWTTVPCENLCILHSYEPLTGYLCVHSHDMDYAEILALIHGLGLCSFDGHCSARAANGVNYLILNN